MLIRRNSNEGYSRTETTPVSVSECEVRAETRLDVDARIIPLFRSDDVGPCLDQVGGQR